MPAQNPVTICGKNKHNIKTVKTLIFGRTDIDSTRGLEGGVETLLNYQTKTADATRQFFIDTIV
jgi:hypothetical protein